MRPRLLDLYSCAGGAGMGYSRAGFDVYAVDIGTARDDGTYTLGPLRRNPFACHHGDALMVLLRLRAGNSVDFVHRDGAVERLTLDDFTAAHASCPCQAYSITKHSHGKDHPELIEPTRLLLQDMGIPYIIENVVGAPLIDPVTLCGTMFDLTTTDDDGTTLYLKRHRLFESNTFIYPPFVADMAGKAGCRCSAFRARGWKVGGVYGGGSVDRQHAENVRRGGYTPGKDKRAALIGVDWMTQDQLSQSIPPAYTEWLGAQLLAAIEVAA